MSERPKGEKTIGVIGGMGPQATVDFMQRLVAGTPARDDADHLHVLVDNNPKIPSRIAALIDGTGQDPTPVLCAMAEGLQAKGADFLVMPCNTAHFYLPAIARSVRIPVLDMVQLAIAKLIRAQGRRVGILASPAVRMVGLYKARMEEAGLEVIFPGPRDEQTLLAVIRAVKAGRLDDTQRQSYAGVAAALLEAGADALLVACTEFSVIGAPPGIAGPVVDALDALVEATIATARN